MDSVSVWEALFMLVVLKIPVVYLGGVVWWAIRAEPIPESGSDEAPALVPLRPCGWDEWKRRRAARYSPRRPHRPFTRVRPALGAHA
ncbi:MAG: hypothetical protein ACRDPZ_05390 [Gaiellaceae bacterium]